jgi:uncharacterized protein (TIGR03545 family)
MKKWFRWWGILAFAGVTALIFILWFFVVDFLIARTITRTGTQIVGAKVELDSADLSLFPLGLELKKLQVTSLDDPMKNAFEIARANLSLDTGQILLHKFIVDEMTLEGVQFNTPRKTSGAVVKKPEAPKSATAEKSSKEGQPSLFGDLEVPDVKEILKREELKTLTLVQSLEDDLKNGKQKWQARLKQLPDKEKLESYRQRLEKLKGVRKGGLGNLLGATTDATALEKDLTADIKQLEGALKTYEDDLKDYEKRLSALSQAPMEDIRRLRNKYSLSTKGLSDISGLIFGNRVRGWAETALTWYDRMAPLLSSSPPASKGPKTVKPIRGGGRDVQFKAHESLPNFLIRHTNAGIILDQSELSGVITNLTTEQDVLGLPLVFNFAGKDLENIGSVVLDGRLDYVVPSKGRSKVAMALRGLRLNQRALSDLPRLPITIEQGTAYLIAQTSIEQKQIAANLIAKIESARLSTAIKASDAPYASLLNSALASVKQLNASATVSGSLDNYQIDVSSDLDRILRNALDDFLRQQTQRLESALTQAVNEKVDGPIQSARQSVGGFETIGTEIKQRLDIGKNLPGAGKLPF